MGVGVGEWEGVVVEVSVSTNVILLDVPRICSAVRLLVRQPSSIAIIIVSVNTP